MTKKLTCLHKIILYLQNIYINSSIKALQKPIKLLDYGISAFSTKESQSS